MLTELAKQLLNSSSTLAKQLLNSSSTRAKQPLPRKSSGDPGTPEEHQGVHLTRCKVQSTAPATQTQRRPRYPGGKPGRTSDPVLRTKRRACHAKAAETQVPRRDARAYIRPRAEHKVPRLPRKSSGGPGTPEGSQGVHPTPC